MNRNRSLFRPGTGLWNRKLLVALTSAIVVLTVGAGCRSMNFLETNKYQTGLVKGERSRTSWGLNLLLFGVRYGEERYTHWGPLFPWVPGFPLLSFELEKDKGFAPQEDASWNVRFPGPGLPVIFASMYNMGAAPEKDGEPAHGGESGFTTPLVSVYEGNVETFIIGPPWLPIFRRDRLQKNDIDYSSTKFLAGLVEIEDTREGATVRFIGLGGSDFKDYPVYCSYLRDRGDAFFGHRIVFKYAQDFLKPGIDLRYVGTDIVKPVGSILALLTVKVVDVACRAVTGNNAKLEIEAQIGASDVDNEYHTQFLTIDSILDDDSTKAKKP